MRATRIRNSYTMRVQFGDICCALICHDADIFDRLEKLYDIFRSDKPADVNIKLDSIDRLNRAQVEAILSQMSTLQQEEHPLLKKLSDIEFNADSNTFTVRVDRRLFNSSPKLGIMNHLFRVAYFTASRLKNQERPPGMLVHSCGILRNGQVLLFAGPCETGKTTIGRLCPGDYGTLLNDEMVLLSWPTPGNSSLRVRSVPILSELPFLSNTPAPLACVMLLKQSKHIAVRRLVRREACSRFMYQIVNPAYFQQTDRRAILSLIVEFADEITKAVPFYELEFTPDRNLLWEVEAKINESKVTEKEYVGRSNSSG
jgi:hypothetical protein